MKIKWENIVNIRNECNFIQEIKYGDFNYAIGKKLKTCPLFLMKISQQHITKPNLTIPTLGKIHAIYWMPHRLQCAEIWLEHFCAIFLTNCTEIFSCLCQIVTFSTSEHIYMLICSINTIFLLSPSSGAARALVPEVKLTIQNMFTNRRNLSAWDHAHLVSVLLCR